MSGLEDLLSRLSGMGRAIVISRGETDLRPGGADNSIFILTIGEGSLAAGGRGGGFGERKVKGVSAFQKKGGSWTKVYDAPDEQTASKFEVPYYVSRLPITLADGSESMGYGVVEPELVASMARIAGFEFSA